MEIRFENTRSAAYDGEKLIGECDFETDGKIWNAIHTEVDPNYGGQGIAKKLVQCLAENAALNGAKIKPVCSYVVKEFEKNPQEYCKVMFREVLQNRIYRHFKGDRYLVVDVAKHSETKETYVVYRKLYGDGGLWIRPLDMFLEPVDKEKYPNCPSTFRFELENIDSVAEQNEEKFKK